MSSPAPRLLLIFCLWCLASETPVHAERKVAPTIGVAPPQPVEMNLRVRREGKTEIPLRIYGKVGEPLKYLIRVPPAHGRLSEPRPTEREVSVVIYEPPADLGITADKFAYAVQNAIGVSAAVEVNLTIVDQPPQLAIQDTIDFSTVRAGAAASRMLEISNHGGLIAHGEIIVEAPWKIEGKTGYNLRAGDVGIYKLIFAPTTGGKYENVARYTSDPEHSTTLRGVAEAAISANPAEWTLQQLPGDTNRSGNFELTNHLDEPRTLQLKTDARLTIPAQVTIPPHGKITVPVEASAQDVRALETAIHLEASDFSTAVPVHVPVLAAVLRATTPVVAFGRLDAGHKASATFELENIGGTPGAVQWEINAPFHVPETSAKLQPGEKKTFHVEINSPLAGRYRTWLEFKAGAHTFELPVQAEVASSQKPAVVSPSATPFSTGAPPAPSEASAESTTVPVAASEGNAEDFISALPRDWIADPKLPKGVRVTNITKTSAEIEWPASLAPGITQFRVDMRQFKAAPDGKLTVLWLQPTGIPIKPRGANFAAILSDLTPGQPWTVRVMPVQSNGEVGERLFAVDFFTPRKSSFMQHITTKSGIAWLLGLFLALLVWQGVQRWRPRERA